VQNDSRNTDLFQRCYKNGDLVKTLAVIFGSVFLAELGDKTQMATMLYATEKSVRPIHVFIAASAALVFSTLLAVVFGETVTRVIPARTLKTVAGLVFVLVGIWTIVKN
jgi:putative Ca2+/H+ antiporter (TMEM165/GDT1 family)